MKLFALTPLRAGKHRGAIVVGVYGLPMPVPGCVRIILMDFLFYSIFFVSVRCSVLSRCGFGYQIGSYDIRRVCTRRSI